MLVQISFDLFANGLGSWFTLDDATKGVLDNTTYVLAGDIPVDVTTDVREVQVKRGRSRQLQHFTAGAANVRLSNRTRNFDPTYAASPYYGSVIPGKKVTISHLGQTLYTGSVADWNLDYQKSGDNTAEASCVDGFSLLAQQNATPGTATSQLTGARITAYLDDAAWPATQRSISIGQATLGADVIPVNTNTLQYLQKVGDFSEPGAVFISKTGDFTFRDRADLQAASGVVFGTGGIDMFDYQVIYGSEELNNAITVTYTGGTAVVTNDTSIASYGALEMTVDSLLSDSYQATKLATWLSNKYGSPQYRINSLTVALHGVSSASALSVLGLELGQTVTVTWTPGNVGTALTQYVNIEGIEHRATPSEHFVTFTLSQTFAAFTIGSSTFGIIGTNQIGW